MVDFIEWLATKNLRQSPTTPHAQCKQHPNIHTQARTTPQAPHEHQRTHAHIHARSDARMYIPEQ